MRKYVEKLVNAKKSMRVGNHSVKIFPTNKSGFELYWNTFYKDTPYHAEVTRTFEYHGNAICGVNDIDKTFFVTNAGWNTSSTNQAINQYRYYFSYIGYKEYNPAE